MPRLPRNRRRMLIASLGGLVVLAALAFVAVYAVLFGGSGARPLALSSSTSSPPVSTASPPSGQGPVTLTIAKGSVAGYRVREQLAFLAAPSDAVGRTSAVTGTLTLAQSAAGYTVTAVSLTVDVSTLTSDRSMRDQRIHQIGLESDRYPTATFKLTSPIALPAAAASGQAVRVSATGDLTVHGTTRSVTIPIDARLTGSQIEAVGSLTFPFSEFNMVPPSIGGFVTVQNDATMEFDLLLQRA